MTFQSRRALQMAALLALIAASAEAQQLAGSFDQLRVLVKPGDTLTITDRTGQRLRGKLTQLSASSLDLDVSGALRQFQESDVSTIEKRGSDSLKNGALIGMVVGGGILAVGALAAGVSSEEAGLLFGAALLYTGVGAGVGAGIDALVEGRQVIYASSSSAGTKLTIAPVLSRPRKGVLVSLRLSR